MAIIFWVLSSLQSFKMSLRVRCVIVQNRNMIHTALSSAFMILTIKATLPGSLVNWENRLAVSMKNGAPGG